MQETDVRHGTRSPHEGPRHPWVAATLLMVGIVVLLVVLALPAVVR